VIVILALGWKSVLAVSPEFVVNVIVPADIDITDAVVPAGLHCPAERYIAPDDIVALSSEIAPIQSPLFAVVLPSDGADLNALKKLDDVYADLA
jgi:hypothetical protein